MRRTRHRDGDARATGDAPGAVDDDAGGERGFSSVGSGDEERDADRSEEDYDPRCGTDRYRTGVCRVDER